MQLKISLFITLNKDTNNIASAHCGSTYALDDRV